MVRSDFFPVGCHHLLDAVELKLARRVFGEGTNLGHYIIRASFWQERMTYVPAYESIELALFFPAINYCGSGQSPWGCDYLVCILEKLT
jgi:hypothetical protein